MEAQDTQKPPPKGFLNAVIIWPARTLAMATATASISAPAPVSRSCQKLTAWVRGGLGGRHEWDLTLTAVYLNSLTHSAHTCAPRVCVYGSIGYLSGRAYLGRWEGRLFCDASLNYLVCTALEWKLLENLISKIYSCFLSFVATASFGPCSNDRKQVCSNN